MHCATARTPQTRRNHRLRRSRRFGRGKMVCGRIHTCHIKQVCPSLPYQAGVSIAVISGSYDHVYIAMSMAMTIGLVVFVLRFLSFAKAGAKAGRGVEGMTDASCLWWHTRPAHSLTWQGRTRPAHFLILQRRTRPGHVERGEQGDILRGTTSRRGTGSTTRRRRPPAPLSQRGAMHASPS